MDEVVRSDAVASGYKFKASMGVVDDVVLNCPAVLYKLVSRAAGAYWSPTCWSWFPLQGFHCKAW